MSILRPLVAFGVVALVAGCGGSTISLGAGNGAPNGVRPSVNHKVFDYTGKEQTFTVPAGITRLIVVAHGGEGSGFFGSGPSSQWPGLPGRVYAVIRVHPGEKLYVFVGASGPDGGFNGGGSGGSDAYGGGKGGPGGGASDIRGGGDTLKDRIIVAAGGGGAGSTGASAPYGFDWGGDGGGSVGQSGAGGGSRSANGGGGGSGGTQSKGGSGGAGGVGVKPRGNGHPGDNGKSGLGGNGGNGGLYRSLHSAGGGGGGGGGYYGGGGGGGGGASSKDYWLSQGGGGGGGSSYIEPNAITSRMWTGWRESGDGRVIFSW
jgi:hypothetical protein